MQMNRENQTIRTDKSRNRNDPSKDRIELTELLCVCASREFAKQINYPKTIQLKKN